MADEKKFYKPSLSPTVAARNTVESVTQSIRDLFPIVGARQTVRVTNVQVDGEYDYDDLPAQRNARLRGKTWGIPIYGEFEIVSNDNPNKVLSKGKVKLLNLPQMTSRFSYIIDGTEYQVDNQLRLKSGVYARVKENGELESQFNLAEGRGFRMGFDPRMRKFVMTYGTTNIPLLPVLRAVGVSDAEIRSKWGDALFSAAAAKPDRNAVRNLAKALDSRAEPTTEEQAAEIIRAAFAQSKLRTDTTEVTLGKPYSKVDGECLLAASTKLLSISKGTAEPDNRDAFMFKELWRVHDHLGERILNSRRAIERKVRTTLDRKGGASVREVIAPDTFNMPIRAFFTTTAISQQTTQVNPIDMLGGYMRTTIMGPGAIQSEDAILDSAKMVDNGMVGFVDPIETPEGQRTGISTHLTPSVAQIGHEPAIPVFSTKTNAYEYKTPAELAKYNVAFADEYKTDDTGKRTPLRKVVTVVPKGGGDIAQVKPGEVDYIHSAPQHMFSFALNLIPFLPNENGNRAGMAARHMSQAIGLKYREQPLVQVAAPTSNDVVDRNPAQASYEGLLGAQFHHRAPVDGVVTKVTEDAITVKGEDGKSSVVQLYRNFPLNDKKAFITSSPLVKVGDTVKKAQPLADTNFTKDGILSIGTNLRMAYMSYEGMNFEDGLVISETAATKLTSEHLNKEKAYLENGMEVGLRKFRANFPGVVSDENAKKLDDDGVIRVGERVQPGDVIMTVLRKNDPSQEQLLLKGVHKALVRPYRDKSVSWDKGYVGEVTDVVRNGREIAVYIKTEEPAVVGDKLAARYGNKGIVTMILPDEEMPRDKDGNAVDILYSPNGVVNRINPAQIYEVALAKVADKEGRTYLVRNMEPDNAKKISKGPYSVVKVKGHWRTVKTVDGEKRVFIQPYEYDRENHDYQALVQKALDDNGLEDTEELFDPKTGKSYGKVMVGPEYIIKLMHQVGKKIQSRASGAGYAYDANLIPRPQPGEQDGAQRFGELGLYGMLAHGAVHNIREGGTWKSDKGQDEIWTALQTGQALPAPKTTFAYEKFLSYLNVLGVNVEKNGDQLTVVPFTDEQVLARSAGELEDASRVVRGKDLKPEEGGLFDEKITGGPGGKKWSHIKLAEASPNPLFEKAIMSVLGLGEKEYDAILKGEGVLTGNNEFEAKRGRGPIEIVDALGRINVDDEYEAALSQIESAKGTELNKVNRKIKFLRALKENQMGPEEAYTLRNVSVLPPIMRPISLMESGDLNVDGVNTLYRDVALFNNQLRSASGVLPEEEVAPLRAGLYDALGALMGAHSPSNMGTTTDGQDRPPGVMTMLAGRTSPKESYFHRKLLDKRQDLTMRSVIIPDMKLGLDELGIPRQGAVDIFRPFMVRKMVQMGFTPLKAMEEIDRRSTLAMSVMDQVAKERPVLFKRDPVLHKYGIQAFWAKFHDGKTINIHPLTCGGFNADFDGDQMSVFVPVSNEAVEEAKRMMPSQNLINPADGKPMFVTSLDSQLGIYTASLFGKKTTKKYDTLEAALAAAKSGEIGITDVITAAGKTTTAGRIAINNLLPAAMRGDEILTGNKGLMTKDAVTKLALQIAQEHPEDYAMFGDGIKNLGFRYAQDSGFSFKLKDFKAISAIRDKHMAAADRIVEDLRSKKLPEKELKAKTVAAYKAADGKIQEEGIAYLERTGSALHTILKSGAKAKWTVIKQLVSTPMLVDNAAGETVVVPIRQSYGEGLTASSYWTTAAGARKGVLDKVNEVKVPGALSKQVVNAVENLVITKNDCGTKVGISLDINDRELVDRFTATDLKLGGGVIPAGTQITPNLVSKMRGEKLSKVHVRSATKCSLPKGLCATCYGVADHGNKVQIGTNVGVLSGQAIGERGTQLSMRTFHSGGVSGGGGVTSGMPRVLQLLKMPKTLPNKATLADVSGKVQSIKESDVGGWDVTIEGHKHYVPHGVDLKVKPGDSVGKGSALSTGPIDPRELLERTNLDTVQRYLTDEVYNVYAGEGVKRRNVEVVIRAVTNVGRVESSGDIGKKYGILRGDMVPISTINFINKSATGDEKPIKVVPELRGLETLALDTNTDWLARMQYRKIRDTLATAAAERSKSDIHGLHPAPGIVYGAEFGRTDKTKGKEGPY